MLWGVTPVLGMPLVLAAIVGGTLFMIRVWRSAGAGEVGA
jgi:hypothetical protein